MMHMHKGRYVVYKDGKPFRAYQEFAIAFLVMELCEDLSPSHKWDIGPEGKELFP